MSESQLESSLFHEKGEKVQRALYAHTFIRKKQAHFELARFRFITLEDQVAGQRNEGSSFFGRGRGTGSNVLLDETNTVRRIENTLGSESSKHSSRRTGKLLF